MASIASVYVPAFSGGELRSTLNAGLACSAQSILSNLKHLVSTCEEIELSRDEERIPASQDEDFFCAYLALLLLGNDLDSAKYLWKRMEGRLQEGVSEFFSVWAVGRAMWKKENAAEIFSCIDSRQWAFSYNDKLIPLLRESVSRRHLDGVASTYCSIPLQDLATMCGKSVAEISAECSSRGWSIESASSLVYPRPGPASSATGPGLGAATDESVGAEIIYKLSSQVSQLERELPSVVYQEAKK